MIRFASRGSMLFALVATAASSTCAPSGTDDQGAPAVDAGPVVAVPVAPIAGLVEQLAPAGAVEVVILVPQGANPETYEPRLEDLRKAEVASLYLATGHPAFVFESTWLAGLLEGTEARQVEMFSDCELMDEDPHVWLSIPCLGAAAEQVAAALVTVVPDRDAEILERLEQVRVRLAETAASVDRRLGPHRGRSFVVLHPAWGYLARDYGLTQEEVLTHGTEDPGAARLARLIETSREAGVRAILVQPQFNQAPARVVADEIGAELITLDPLERDPVAAIGAAAHAIAAALDPEEPS